MTKCWQEDPDGRPTFTELRNEVKEMENQHKVNYWGIAFQLSKLNSVYKTYLGMLSGVIMNQPMRLQFSLTVKTKTTIITSVYLTTIHRSGGG